MKTENETNSRLDMSLDEIIKLDKKEARKNKQVHETTATRGRRQNISHSRQKPRIPASGTRLRGLKQKRLSRFNRVVQESSSQTKVATKNRGVFTLKNVRSSRSMALAVLRRAQRTAAAAAKTAADATALLQRSRIQRQQLFDKRRSIQLTSRTAYERRPSRRRSAPVSTVGSHTPYSTSQVLGRSWQSDQQSRSFQRRPGRRSRQTLMSIQGRRTSFRGALSRNNSLRNNTARNQRWAQRTSFRSNNRGRQRNGYMPTGTSHPTSRARNAEYLAQARALIRAQNENAQRYNFDNTPNTSVWTPSSYGTPHRNLNYYAKYWDNNEHI
ncbi:putative sperm nuclear basic protein PL-I isoform PLIb [Schistosoma japonicum]|uniref:Putative sperm nuclear basic protein PL-I isoform PLIb n=1 Tax=Schistosoma japonicum TaxID=6182 RepID=A0A4Z2DTV1_SCHJA|nr:sperm nuclear basic protein PL-I isoform PLIb [Schistosoma japonicum]TNN19981.1 putative sperm nuclear basic protein PL-I isoform PLIb [Schistosoma japonicum]